jgi:hypothetical protein
MRVSFEWVGTFLKKTLWPRRKSQPRVSYLFLQPLEDRILMSANVWMPQSVNPNGGNALQLFRPAGGTVEG